jgi:two-component system phosphate regulon sensor histidine kinase PhoR
MSKNKIRWIAFLSMLAIASIILAQGYWVYQLWHLNEKQFSQKVKTTLAKVAQELVELNGSVLPRTKFINQITPNYYVVNINDNINIDILEYFLIKEFQEHHINEDFEYGIYDCSDNQMVYGNYIHLNSEYKSGIQPRVSPSFLPTIAGLNYYFGVLFPNKNFGMIIDLKIALLLSLLLVGAILVYLYALWVIIRQNELSELQKDFINNMTHEFKTPLSNIKLATTAISDYPETANSGYIQRLTSIIGQQNQRLTNHVEKILDLAKMEKDHFVINKEPLNLQVVLDNLSESFRIRIEKENGKLEINMPAEPLIIQADPVHFCNILDNLVDNAIKYSPESPHIKINAVNEPSKVEISISDNGIGMDELTQKKVFSKYYRHTTGNRHDVKGFGLGLYYVQNVCKAHKWKIKIISKIEKGTNIIITIPKI